MAAAGSPPGTDPRARRETGRAPSEESRPVPRRAAPVPTERRLGPPSLIREDGGPVCRPPRARPSAAEVRPER